VERNFDLKPEDALFISRESVRQTILETWCRARADELISVNGLKVDNEDRLKIAKAISVGAQRAVMALKRLAKGDFSPDSPAPLSTRAAGMSALDHSRHSGDLSEWPLSTCAVKRALSSGCKPRPAISRAVSSRIRGSMPRFAIFAHRHEFWHSAHMA
jgi:hypothetical protein